VFFLQQASKAPPTAATEVISRIMYTGTQLDRYPFHVAKTVEVFLQAKRELVPSLLTLVLNDVVTYDKVCPLHGTYTCHT
jgi:hypothetical protein